MQNFEGNRPKTFRIFWTVISWTSKLNGAHVQSQFFRDPPKINEYMATSCEAVDVTDQVQRSVASNFVEGFETLAVGDSLKVCLDSQGYFQEYGECVTRYLESYSLR